MMDDEITCGAPYRQGSATGFHICGGIHRPWPQNVCGLCNCEPVYSPAPAPTAELTAAPAFPGTLLDWFAGMAMQGLVSSAFNYMSDEAATDPATTSALRLMKDIGEVSYQMSYAMMKAREARP